VTHTKEKSSDCTVVLITKHIKNWLQHADDKISYEKDTTRQRNKQQ